MHSHRTSRLAATLAACALLASAGTAALPQQGATPALDVSSQAGLTELSLAGGAAFHRTTDAVEAARLMAIPGTSGVAVAWTQVDATGLATPWYAISQDGESFASVRPTSYVIRMEQASFDPSVELPDLSASGLSWDGEVYLVQFETQALGEYRSALEALGARTYDHLVNHTLIVRMSPEVRAQVQGLEFVRWVGPFHPALRLEPGLLAQVARDALQDIRPYNVMVFERGPLQKEIVADAVLGMGGTVRELVDDGFRLVVELSPDQVVTLASLPEVAAIDPWSPPEVDLNIVRAFSGANYLETQTGFTGQGVRGECFDTGVFVNHQDFQHDGGVLLHGPNSGSTSHGTQVTGVTFGDGTGNSTWRGLLPNGKIVFASFSFLSNRYTHTAQLLQSPYFCVFQTNSWGNSQTTSYNSISVEMDDILFLNDIVITQSQSNTGNQASRPQAWAKNIVAVGGVCHQNTLTKNDDSWCGASIGPASDGRVKPDLGHFYDNTTAPASNGGYSVFGGTSNATPCTAGHFGLFFQMWHNNVWNNGATGPTVFDSKPHATTAKAAMINTADQWNFPGSNVTRFRQGWGAVSVQKLYDTRNETIFVDQTDVLNNLATNAYVATVNVGAPELKVTMVYRDPKGVAFSSTHRINDIDLKVTAPDGTIYWGNGGLTSAMWSSPGGGPNGKDTVENVFVQNPQAGGWQIEVIGADINTDIVPGTPGNNADYSLWVTGATAGGCISPLPYCVSKLTSNFTLPVIDSTGTPSFVTQNFKVTLKDAMPNSSANVFWGSAAGSTPFAGGTLCVAPPVTRGPPAVTDGSGFTETAIPITGPMIGQTLFYQWWFRDQGFAPPNNIGLSNGLQVTFCNS